LKPSNFSVGDVFQVYDKGNKRNKFVVLARFIFRAEHFLLLSLNTFERWTDRELTFQNEFEKSRLTEEEVLYLLGETSLHYRGNINQIGKDLYDFVDERLK